MRPLFCNTTQVIVVSLIVGSLFFRLGHGVNDARSFYGAAFMAVLFMAMGSMPQIGVVMAQKGVWLKHRDGRLYPGYAHGVVSPRQRCVNSAQEPSGHLVVCRSVLTAAACCGNTPLRARVCCRQWRWASCQCR